jgi:putative tRNA adenosine deaminase-associated protein
MVRNLSTARHHVRVSYFTAVIAGDGRSWRARDVDVEDAGSLDDLADTLRGAAHGDGPVLAVIEREDEWFALVRVDGLDDPRVFVSDMAAATRSPFADLLAPAADVEVDAVPDLLEDPSPAVVVGEAEDDDPDDPVEPSPPGEESEDDGLAGDLAEAERAPVAAIPWAGEPDLLDDLGITGRRLRDLTEKHGDDPAAVLAEVGEDCGFGELLDALR